MSMFGEPSDEPAAKPAGDQVVCLRVIVTVKAAPNPSDKYGETVCVAGVSADPARPGWFRLYPINFRELGDDASFRKYDVISVDAVPARQDARAESWRPRMNTLRIDNHVADRHRREWIDPYVGLTTMCGLNRGATMRSPSLGLIQPQKVTDLVITRHPGWTTAQQAKIDKYVGQLDLFGTEDRTALQAPRFIGTYHYVCAEPDCRGHRQGIIDWEFVALQRKLRDRDDQTATRLLRQKFLDQMCAPNRNVAFYVGNLAAHPTTFSVLGVYWPAR
ncbi:MAG TPA: hypothetical protein VHU90_06375 [Galbitalea sp.]|nr:hypothetical protein [Galbitalea sp.]